MPNWCYSNVCFKGNHDNIYKLKQDVEKAFKFSRDNGYYYCNISFLLLQQGFRTEIYNESSPYRINFRGSVIEGYNIIKNYGSYSKIYLMFETAWYIDYDLLHLIAMIYDLEFSAYSEELGMGLFDKCRNGEEDTYDYDFLIRLNYDQFESYVEKYPDSEISDIGCDIPCKENDVENIIKIIEDYEIEYSKEDIYDNTDAPCIHGIYYDRDVYRGIYYGK